jgi:hypothetical protein
MNKRLQIFAGLMLLLVITGGLTSFAAANGSGSLIPGVLTVTSRPEASVNQFGQNQGLMFVGVVAFVLFNLIGASLTGALIFWFLNREVTRAKASDPAQHDTLTEAFGLPQRTEPDEDDPEHELPATT